MRRHEYTDLMALRAMQTLAVRTFPTTGYRHVGDLAWNWCLAIDRPSQLPTAIWTHDDRPVAWGWLELPNSLMLQVDPDHPELADNVLARAERTAPGPLSVEVAETEPHLAAALERRDSSVLSTARSWPASAVPSPICRRGAPSGLSTTMPTWPAGRRRTEPPSARPGSPPNAMSA